MFPGAGRIDVNEGGDATPASACLRALAASLGLGFAPAGDEPAPGPDAGSAVERYVLATLRELDVPHRHRRPSPAALAAGATPMLLVSGDGRCAVADRHVAGRLRVREPGQADALLSARQAARTFDQCAVILPRHRPAPHDPAAPRLRLADLARGIVGAGPVVTELVVLSVAIQALALLSPYYLQLAVDSVIEDGDRSLLRVLAAGFALVVVATGMLQIARQRVLLAAGEALGLGLWFNLANRLFRLPLAWFAERGLGETLLRFRAVAPIQKLLTEDAPAAIVDGLWAVCALAVMFSYSAALALLTLAAVVIDAVAQGIMLAAQKTAQEQAIADSGVEHSVLIETLRGVSTIRALGKEEERLDRWRDATRDSLASEFSVRRLAGHRATLTLVIFGTENVVSVLIAMNLVMNTALSIGMVLAFLAYKAQLVVATSTLFDKLFTWKMARVQLSRMSDIALAAPDPGFTQRSVAPALVGCIEFRDVRFRYGAQAPETLKGISFTVHPGETVVLTGPSGGGKSTLAQLLMGLIEPTGGEILVDGISFARFGYRNLRRQAGAVMQNDVLFAGTLAQNIAMFASAPDLEAVHAAARRAGIADDIEQLPLGYDTMVGDLGATLSGGQRQRVTIARALYRLPRLLVMDEGTSHLDADRERAVNAAIRALGLTRVDVAHRSETIRNADRVLMLENGVITWMGAPAELAVRAP